MRMSDNDVFNMRRFFDHYSAPPPPRDMTAEEVEMLQEDMLVETTPSPMKEAAGGGGGRMQQQYQQLQDIETPTENDVLMGRGGKNNQWTGNEKLRQIARTRAAEYATASKRGKSHISREMVEAMRALSPPGRFLRKCPNSKWEDVGDEIAREKTSQVLRDAIQSKKSFSGDSPTRIVGQKRTGTGTDVPGVPVERRLAAEPPLESPLQTEAKRTPSEHHPMPDQYAYASHQRQPPPSVESVPSWKHSQEPPRHPVSASSMDSSHEHGGWRPYYLSPAHHHHYSSYPYGYHPSRQYPITPVTSHPTSVAPRKRPRYNQGPPTSYDFSPQYQYHSLYAANTPPVADMFSPPNARMQAFSPASAPSISSNQSYAPIRAREVHSSAPSERHPFAASARRISGHDSWIGDVPAFSLSTATTASPAEQQQQQQQQQQPKPSPPGADLGLFQEDLLSDSEHDREDGSISPVTYPPK